MGKLDGRTAMITGSARGMGAGEARLFIAEGANVLICDVLDELGEVLAQELGAAAMYVHLDVSDEAQWAAAVERGQGRFGRLDVLVNNAGIAFPATIEDTPLEQYQRVVAVNLTGVWLGLRAAAPALRAAGGGSIVNMSSSAGLTASPGLAAYGATKWAVRGLTKTAAAEFSAYGIRVNSVHPGLISTDMTTAMGLQDMGVELGAALSALGRVGTVEDVAGLVLFLACDDSAYCTGGEFLIDGGMLLAGRPRADAPEDGVKEGTQ